MGKLQVFTVGWICAISTELTAARSFLDEEYDSVNNVSREDYNNYALGKMGRHNVVLAILPDGEYRTAAAAVVAVAMLRKFPNIRIGLTVGIAGGAPSSRHDIRLGDVVVSIPCDGHGGVLEYDFGKTIQNQALHITRYLNEPPILLRSAAGRLMVDYKISGHNIKRTIERIIEQTPRLREKYQRPPLSSDILYQSAIIHPTDSEMPCSELCGVDPSRTVRREPRDNEDEDDHAIHYGVIASAPQAMEDAQLRDKLAAEKNVLCFEMEAAGVMNYFPCLVIRGICDYSDTHKNKQWHGYAAMTAAAYAKDLLSQIPLTKDEFERSIKEDFGSTAGTGSRETASGELGGMGSSPTKSPSTDLVGYLNRDSVDACIARDREQFFSKTRELIQKSISTIISGGIWHKRDRMWELSHQWRKYFHLHRTIPFEEELSGPPSPQMTRSYPMRMVSDTRLGGDGISRQMADLYDVIAVMDYAGGWQNADIEGEEGYEWI
ncbi:nucleoside phosphorylase domain-containing protein [Trichoderma sp. SZMC 28012]